MKKIISISIVCVFVSLITGCQLGYMGACKKYRKGPDFYKLYDLLQKKSDLADSIMDRNNVYDMDGGDQVAEYLRISSSIDSIYIVNK
mgnify:FL=1